MREAERGGREEGWRARGREVESRTPPTPSSHPSLTPPGTHAWLVNTGWTGGAYGAGSRIKLRHTRAILDAIHAGALDKAATTRSLRFSCAFSESAFARACRRPRSSLSAAMWPSSERQ